MDVSLRTAEAIDVDVRVGDAALVDGEDVADELGEIDLLRAGGLFVEAKGLRGDGRDAAKFDFGCSGSSSIDIASPFSSKPTTP